MQRESKTTFPTKHHLVASNERVESNDGSSTEEATRPQSCYVSTGSVFLSLQCSIFLFYYLCSVLIAALT